VKTWEQKNVSFLEAIWRNNVDRRAGLETYAGYTRCYSTLIKMDFRSGSLFVECWGSS